MASPSSSETSHRVNGSTVSDVKLNWKRLVSPFHSRYGHAACVCEGLVYVFGGVVERGQEEFAESNELISFNPVTHEWLQVPPSDSDPLPRNAPTMASVGEKLYLFGGLNSETGWLNDLHIFDTKTKKWSELKGDSKPPSPRDKLASTVIGDCIYFFGGFGPQTDSEEIDVDDDDDDDDDEDDNLDDYKKDQDAAQFGWFDSLFIYNTVSNSWSEPMQMNKAGPSPRAAHSLNTVTLGGSEGAGDPHLVVFGGRDCEERRNDVYLFNTVSRTWVKDFSVTGSAPAPRSYHSATSSGSRVFIVGGRGSTDQHYNDVHVLDLDSRTWVIPLPTGDTLTPRDSHSAVIIDNQLIVYGGSGGFSPLTHHCSKFFNDVLIGDIVLPLSMITSSTKITNYSPIGKNKKCPQTLQSKSSDLIKKNPKV